MVSGCLEGAPAPATSTARAAAAPYELHCPAGSGGPADCAPGVPLASLLEQQGEPFVAIDPSNPDRVAAGLISANPSIGGAAHASRLRFVVSEDGGVSWRDMTIPDVLIEDAIPLRLRSDADPALAFDADGTLHVVGLATRLGTLDAGGAGRTSRVFHAATPDLGDTWTGPSVLGDGIDNDRPWIGVAGGTAVITWQTTTGNRDMLSAWSSDQGASWTVAKVRGSCNLVSPPLVDSGGFVATCHDRSGAECELPLLRVAFDGAAAHVLSCLPGPICGTNLLARLPDGGLVWACISGWAAASPNGGLSWNASVNLVDRTSLGKGTQGFSIFAMAADPEGFLHVVLANYAAAALPVPPGGGGYSAGYAVMDVVEWNPVSETLLTRPDVAGPMTDFKGEFAGVAFGAGSGLAAWVDREHHVRVAPLAPAVADA